MSWSGGSHMQMHLPVWRHRSPNVKTSCFSSLIIKYFVYNEEGDLSYETCRMIYWQKIKANLISHVITHLTPSGELLNYQSQPPPFHFSSLFSISSPTLWTTLLSSHCSSFLINSFYNYIPTVRYSVIIPTRSIQ